MPPRNPSELARLDEEAASLTRIVFGGGHFSKSYKEDKLRELRIIERQLGVPGRAYNEKGSIS